MLKKSIVLLLIVVVSGFLINNNFKSDALTDENNVAVTEDQVSDVQANKYVCPMHSHIISHEADSCPICGMDLVINKSAIHSAESSAAMKDENNVLVSSDQVSDMQSNKYVCPMHSHIVSHEADSCPVCGMDLVLNKSAISSTESDSSSSAYPEVKISPLVAHNLGVRTAIVERGDLTHTIETIGKITRVDPMARTRIAAPINGTIIKMVDKYSGDTVKQGEFLFSIASEELFDYQKEFQQAFLAGDKAKSSDMIPKLASMGLDAGQIAQLQKGAEPTFAAEIYAHEDGYIFTRRGKEGEVVTSSYTVFNLGGDYQVIEVTVEIFERQWDVVKEGQAASMVLRNLPSETFHGTVVRVDEPVGYTTRALEARLKFKTDFEGLTQSSFARVLIDAKTKHDVLTVPRDAIIRTAKDNRVIKVNEDGKYQPVVVTIGEESNGKVEIISGINPGCKVVVSGQFLIDSESNLMSDLLRMSGSDSPSAEIK